MVTGKRTTHMRALLMLLPWALTIAAIDAAPLGAREPQTQAGPAAAREEGDEAKERNEARARPARGAADKGDDDDDKNDDHKNDAAKPDHHNDDRKDDAPTGESAKLSLTASQQEAVGIRIETPRQLSSAPEIEAYATVLDPLALLTDAGRIESTRATALAASADAARQENLYRDGAHASLKSLQASQAQSVEASAQAQAALMAFRQQWGPLATWTDAQRRALLTALGEGQRLLVRADVPGRHLSGAIGRDALLDVDGVHIAARVLGALPRADAQAQSAGWLLLIERPPQGLGPGARAPVRLKAAPLQGLLVPATALIYAEQGAYVYRQIRGNKRDTFVYEAVAVRPLTRVGAAWLVEGLARVDQIVVQGAGVLWSLQGISSFSAAEEEHD